MLRGGSTKASVGYKMAGVWEELKCQQTQLLYQSCTMLRVGACEYELQYTLEEKHIEAYLNQRDGFLVKIPASEVIQPPFRVMPGDSCVPRGRYLEFGTHGSGAFGWINQGVDTKTGDPVAIKELRITNPRSRLDTMMEVNMGRQFLVSQTDV